MKDNLPYFAHDNDASQHPKMRALIATFGYEGYGRFWILNEKIARSPNAALDVSRRVNKLDLAKELDLDENELDKFLNFLADQEIDLINNQNGTITTDRVNELYSRLMEVRKKERGKKQRQKGKEQIPEGKDDFPQGNRNIPDKFPGENDTDQIRSDKTILDQTKQDKKRKEKDHIGSDEPILSESQKAALELSELLLSSHRKVIPNFLSGKDDKKTIQRWAADIEKLMRLDEKSPDIIRQIILWVKTPDNFWFPNIESGDKLRKKFEVLYGQMISKSQRSKPVAHKITRDNVAPEDIEKFFS